jgi:SAM-dependent methyltransferase
VQPEEYARIRRHEERHFWFRGVHALLAGALSSELERRGARAASTAGGAAPRVLDAGCGTGGLLRSLQRAAPRALLFGFDLSPLALSFSRERGLARLVRASIERVPFRSGEFDAVVSADVLYHRGVSDDAAALRDLARVVKPGGAVLLHLPAHPALRGAHDEAIHTARRYSRADVRRLAAAAGLEVERLRWFHCALLPVAFLVRRLTRGGPPRSDVALPPAPLNAIFSGWTRLEAWAAPRFPLPFGLSLFAHLRRAERGAPRP